MRKFNTGATRDTDTNKLDYEGFLSPVVLKRYAEYLNKHRVQADGNLRDSDNWQKGIPKDVYIKSMFRHFIDVHLNHREFSNFAVNRDIEESLCAVIFNAMGYLFELLKTPTPIVSSIEVKAANKIKAGNAVAYNQPITAYLSHPIRGKAGSKSTRKEMEANYRAAKKIASQIQDLFPNLSLYVPADMDDFLLKYEIEPLNIANTLLNLDCKIIENRNVLLVYSPDEYISNGMKIEIDHADKKGIPTIKFKNIKQALELIGDYLQ